MKRRPRGRPETAVNVDRREDILNAAERLFALQGFSATAIREIAEEVDVNTAMVHYYFGSKTQLLQAVMDRVLEPLAVAISGLQEQEQVNIQDFISLVFQTVSTHQFLPQLVAREVFLPGGKMQQQFLEQFAPRLGGRLPGILQKAQQAGQIKQDLNPNITAMMILSLCFFPFMAKPATEAALGVSYNEQGLKDISRHISSLLQGGLMK